MKDAILKIKNSKATDIIKRVLSNRFFPFATAFVTVLFYYLNLEIVTIYFITLTGILTVLLLDDISPLISNFLFMSIMISLKHSPSTFTGADGRDAGYLARPEILAQIVTLVSLYVIAVFTRLAFTVKKGKFKITPVFWTLAVFGLVLILNGVGSKKYQIMDLVYGIFLAFCFFGIFCIVKDNVSCTREMYVNIAYSFLALSVALLLELVVKYITADIIKDGIINRKLLAFGWGMYNNLALLMLLCVPSVMYLAGTQKFGYLYFVYSIVLAAGVIFTMSRQAWVALAVVYLVSLAALLIIGKYRLINCIITGVAAVIIIVLFAVFKDKILLLLSGTPKSNGINSLILLLCASAYIIGISVLNIMCKNKKIKYSVTGASLIIILLVAAIFHEKTFELLYKLIESSNGRNTLWKDAVKNFTSAPAFGVGFFVNLANDPGYAGMAIIPDMYHNTFFQLLGSCGIIGLTAYLVHRVFTLISFFKDMSTERSYIGLTILCILITTLFDNHLFYILPTIIYSILLAVMVKAQEVGADGLKTENKAEKVSESSPSAEDTKTVDDAASVQIKTETVGVSPDPVHNETALSTGAPITEKAEPPAPVDNSDN